MKNEGIGPHPRTEYVQSFLSIEYCSRLTAHAPFVLLRIQGGHVMHERQRYPVYEYKSAADLQKTE